MILLCTYQRFHRIYCNSASLAWIIRPLVLNIDSDATVDTEIPKISCATLARIGYFFTITFFINSKYQNILPHSIEE